MCACAIASSTLGKIRAWQEVKDPLEDEDYYVIFSAFTVKDKLCFRLSYNYGMRVKRSDTVIRLFLKIYQLTAISIESS